MQMNGITLLATALLAFTAVGIISSRFHRGKAGSHGRDKSRLAPSEDIFAAGAVSTAKLKEGERPTDKTSGRAVTSAKLADNIEVENIYASW